MKLLLEPVRDPRSAVGKAAVWLDRPRPVPDWLPLATISLLVAPALLLYSLSLREVDVGRITGLGLVSVLPVLSFVALGLLTLAFFLTLAQRRPYPVLLVEQLVALIACLHGVTAAVEPQPRFATAWLHAGFVEYIARTGEAAVGLDARFSWPGFFALVALVTGLVGEGNLATVLWLAPVVVDVLYLVPLLLLLRTTRASWRAVWFAAWLFCVANWVGQDYFSPQAFNYLLYLLFLAIALTWFAAVPARRVAPAAKGRAAPLARLRRRAGLPSTFEPGELPPRPAGPVERAGLALLLVLLFTVSTVSHQLTPFMLLGAATVLVLARRFTLTRLPLLMGVILLGWISYMTVSFWSGHLSGLLRDFGEVGANLTAGVGDRMLGGSPERLAVLGTRVAFSVGLVGLAAIGLVRRLRRGIADGTALLLLVVPYTALAAQSYGGELPLRTYLFALPPTCLLAAFAFFPSAGAPPAAAAARANGRAYGAYRRWERRHWPSLVAACACGLALIGGFFVARYGNERFERFTSGETAAVAHVYRHARPGTQVVWLTPNPEEDFTPHIPWGYRDLDKVGFTAAEAPRDPDDVDGLAATLRDLGPGAMLITTRGQEAALELIHSFPPGWGERLRSRLARSEHFRMTYANDDAAVFDLRPAGEPTGDLVLP